jgi:predicted amino acid racemase
LTAPRLEIDLNRLHHNARTLVERLGRAGIAITGVSKATLGLPEIVATWIAAGVPSIGESRIASIEALHRSAIPVPLLMVRSPMLHEVARVVAHAAISCNSEAVVLRALAAAAQAQGLRHGVLLMVELGDLREGILPADLEAIVQLTLALPNLQLLGLATNLGCQHGVAPDASNMAELSALTSAQEARFGIRLPWCSGGNSANLPWLAAGGAAGRINHLRLGEALLLGREPLSRSAIPGLYTDAITLVAEVIESKRKPMRPWGTRQRSSFDHRPAAPSAEAEPRSEAERRGEAEPQLAMRTILALGEQDADPASLSAAGLSIEGASSDHLIVSGANPALAVGDEQRFQIGYSSLLRAMTSPFVARCFV